MNKYYYKHLSNWERRKIESLIGNKPILKPIFGVKSQKLIIVLYMKSILYQVIHEKMNYLD